MPMFESSSAKLASLTPALPPGHVSTPQAGDPGPLRLDPLLARSPIGVAVIAYDGTYETVNPAYCATYGYAANELVGHSFTMVFPPEQHAAVIRRHQRYLDATATSDLGGEWEVLRRDGSSLSVLSESVRVVGPDGQCSRLVYVLDITERKRMEQALGRSQQFTRAVLDSLPGQVCVLDEQGQVLQVNRSWRAHHAAQGGQPHLMNDGADFLGHCRALAQGLPSHAPTARLWRELQALLDGCSPGFQQEMAGHTVRERRWFLVRGVPLADSDPPRFVISYDDITALRQAQNTLQDQQALLLDLAASMPGAMFRMVAGVHGGLGEYVYLSPGVEPLLGLSAAEVCANGRSLLACIHEEDRPGYERSLREAAAGPRTWEHEFRVTTVGGQRKWVRVQAMPKPLGLQALVWTGVLTDVSESQRRTL